MKLAIFVHELFLEIGHSNATIELIRNLPQEEIEEIHIVAFKTDDPHKLFPDFKGKFVVHSPLIKLMFPFLLREVYFQLYAFWVALFLKKDVIKYSVGSSSLVSDVVNIQFLTTQWEPFYFKMRKFPLVTLIYKKIFYHYLMWAEKIAYTNKKKYVILAKFVADYMREQFGIEDKNTAIIYSSVNVDRFSLDETPRMELYEELKKKYPQLSVIDPSRPIVLFVGAYERKGLGFVLDNLNPEDQIIIVGSPESDAFIDTDHREFVVAKVTFTKEVQKFYALCDVFAFPSIYEPFGLVLFEAAAMGIRVITCRHMVGASEILIGLDGIELIERPEDFKINDLKIVDLDTRKKWRESRLPKMLESNWQDAGRNFKKLLETR